MKKYFILYRIINYILFANLNARNINNNKNKDYLNKNYLFYFLIFNIILKNNN